MSSNGGVNQNINSVADNFNGGLVAGNDLAPAIVFSVALVLALPLLIWRLVSKKHRSKIYANAIAFFLLRLASLIIRAYMSRREYGSGVLVAQAILMSIGYLPLLNALIDIWQTRAEKGDEREGTAAFEHKQKKLTWVKYVGWFLRFLLIASLATAIAAGVILSRNYTVERQAEIIRNLLKASYIISLVVTVLGMILKAISTIMNHESIKRTALLYAYSIPLLIVSIYRVVSVFTGYRATKNAIVAFYVAMIFFEFVAYMVLLGLSLKDLLRKHSVVHDRDHDIEKRNMTARSEATATPRDSMATRQY